MKRIQFFWIIGGIILILMYGFFDPDKFSFPLCPFRTITGLLCPGCGSQRAMHQVLHGHLVEAFRLNPMFLPAILYGLSGMILKNGFPDKWPVIRSQYFGLKACYISLIVILIFSVARNLF